MWSIIDPSVQNAAFTRTFQVTALHSMLRESFEWTFVQRKRIRWDVTLPRREFRGSLILVTTTDALC